MPTWAIGIVAFIVIGTVITTLTLYIIQNKRQKKLKEGKREKAVAVIMSTDLGINRKFTSENESEIVQD
jgi:hypothetical protein